MHATRTIADVMTRGVYTLSPGDTVLDAACAMEQLDVGALPVCDGERLVGMVTDRDIVLRSVALQRPATTPLREIMSQEVVWCFEDEPVDDVLGDMVQRQIRRLPVMNRQKQLVGLVSLGDIAAKTQNVGIGGALGEISLPAAPVRRPEPSPGLARQDLPQHERNQHNEQTEQTEQAEQDVLSLGHA